MAHATLPSLPPPPFPQTQLLQLSTCTHADRDGYECGDPAVVQMLPDGDEACCAKHLRLRQLRAALAEVSRG